jgi:MFS family permease
MGKDKFSIAQVSAPRERSKQIAWIPVAAILLSAGWASNQFTPMLLVYARTLGLSTGTLEAMFGFYALGLIPGLLVGGPLSDRRGRRPVVLASATLSLAGSVVLAAAAGSVAALFAGRVLIGLGTGAAFSAGTAWLRELSKPPFGTLSDASVARRAAVTMTTGFALGPIVAGLLAQWAPGATVVPYLPHIALAGVVLLAIAGVPETVVEGGGGTLRAALPQVRSRRFLGVVVPMAAWVFTAPAIAFALLPTVVGAGEDPNGVAITAFVTMMTAVAGVLIQPLAHRLNEGARTNRAASVGLLVLTVGLGLAAVTAGGGRIWLLLPTAMIMGVAYGLCLVAGLVEVQRIAEPSKLAGLTAVFYALAYLGFASPYLFALGAHLASYAELLAIAAGLAITTWALVIHRSGSRHVLAAPLPRTRRANTDAADARCP